MTAQMTHTDYDTTYVERIVRLLVKPGGVLEVRILRPKHRRKWGDTVSGYFDNPADLAHAIEQLDGQADGIYITAQGINPALLARAHNRLLPWARTTTSDGDVLNYRWLIIDTDPVRPKGVSATDEELAQALACRDDITAYLEAAGWPDPVRGMSGNGGHLLYRLPDVPVADGKTLVENTLKALANRFDNEAVNVDQSLFNASRIIKLYGTMACKGDDTADRPHRRSFLELPDDEPKPVTIDQLKWLAEQVPVEERRPQRSQSSRPPDANSQTDLGAILDAADIKYTVREADGYTKYLLDECLFNPDHKTPDAMFTQGYNGALGYKCLHNSCEDNDWCDAKEVLDGRIPGGIGQFFSNHVECQTENTDSSYLNTLLQAAKDASVEERPQQLQKLAEALVDADPFTVAYYASHVKEEGLANKGDFTTAVRNAARARHQAMPADTDATTTPTHDELGDRWLVVHQDDTIFTRGKWYRYACGIWELTEEVPREMWQILVDAKPEDVQPKKGVKASVLDYVQERQRTPDERLDARDHFICLENGVFDLETFGLVHHDPSFYITSKLPFGYDPDATSPTWQRAMVEWTGGNSRAILHLQEAYGYSLTSDMRYQKAWLLVGDGDNGKDTYLNSLRALAGTGHYELDLSMLTRSQYGLAKLPGKRVVTCTEAVTDKKMADAYLKRLISGETMEARLPYGQPFNFRPICKIWWAVNEKPYVADQSYGFWRRWIVVPFEQRFEGDRRDNALGGKLLNELPGIFNWAMVGLRRLREQGHFTEVPEFLEATERYRQENDVTALYITEACVTGPNLYETPKNLYAHYQDYCRASGYRPRGKIKFGNALVRLGYPRGRLGDKDGTRVHFGIARRPPENWE